jgi:hypothetical protein
MASFDRARIVLDVADAPHHHDHVVLVGCDLPIGGLINLIADYSRGCRSSGPAPHDRGDPIEGGRKKASTTVRRGDRLSTTASSRLSTCGQAFRGKSMGKNFHGQIKVDPRIGLELMDGVF